MTQPIVSGDRASAWSRWIWQVFFPAVVVGAFSVAFSVGVYVGRVETAIELAEVRSEVTAHAALHLAEAGTIEVRLSEIIRRVGRVERLLENLPAEQP